MTTVRVIMPSSLVKPEGADLNVFFFYAKSKGHIKFADICVSAMECKCMSYKFTYFYPEGEKASNNLMVLLTLEFMNVYDKLRFIESYNSILSDYT